MTRYAKITSKKQHIRLWFDCYKICLSQPEYAANLEKSKSFYEEWGDVSEVLFDPWWKEKKYLFEDQYVKEVNRVSNNPNTINLSIPLNEKISVIMREAKRIVEKRQIEKLEELGIDHQGLKSKPLSFSKYSFNQKEFKGRYFYQNLEMYKIYLNHGKPPINQTFLVTMYEDFKNRPRTIILKTLYLLNDGLYKSTNAELDNEIRTIRRAFKSIDKTLTNVSKGKFP